MTSDPFRIVEPEIGGQPEASPNQFARGDDWIITKSALGFKLSYLSGHFATEEKTLLISESDALSLADGAMDLDKFLLSKQQ
jgi:hypothetical protein